MQGPPTTPPVFSHFRALPCTPAIGLEIEGLDLASPIGEPGTVVVWNNHTTTHYAVPDYHPAYRLLHRVTF